MRRRLHEIQVQARNRCGTCGQHETTRHNGNESAHDPTTWAATPQNTAKGAREIPRKLGPSRARYGYRPRMSLSVAPISSAEVGLKVVLPKWGACERTASWATLDIRVPQELSGR